MCIEKGLAFLTTETQELFVYNVSNPLHPTFISSLSNEMLWGQAVAVSGTTVFIAQYAAGLRAVDISNLNKLAEIAAIRDHYNGLSYDVFIQDDYIFVADGWDGLEIYELLPQETENSSLYVLVFLPLSVGFVVVTIIVLVRYRRKERA